MSTLLKGEFILKRAIILMLSMVFLSACNNEPSHAEQDFEEVSNYHTELKSQIKQIRSKNETVESDIKNKEKELEELSSDSSADDPDENTEEEENDESEEDSSEDAE